jgi:6-pyruvoyltetrahydropterin/6-carboxytetrahydropterin synthase
MAGEIIMLMVSFSRVYTFSSSHRLHSDLLNLDKNIEVYDKCNNFNGHGHDYTLEVTLKGPVHPDTGMVYSLDKFDENVNSVLDKLDYKHLDKEVPFFKEHISTGEVIIQYLWQEFESLFKGNLLHYIKLWETNNNYFELGKEMN